MKIKPRLVGLVLCNPPFHQGNTLGDFIARQMSRTRTGVGDGRNAARDRKHAPEISRDIKKIFGNSAIVAANAKFTIVDAVKVRG